MPICFAYLCPILLAANIAAGSVTGFVKDAESGKPVIGAVVTLVELGETVQSDGEGRYTFLDVPAGPQHMVVHRIGYAARTFHALVPRTGVLEIDVALRSEPIPIEPIEVGGNVPIRGLEEDSEAPYPNRNLSIASVRHHPLLSEPDVLQAAQGGEITLDPESPSGIHVRGGGSDQIVYLLDGFPILNPYHAAGTFSAFNPDALSNLALLSLSSHPPYPDALSGIVSAKTRDPGARFQMFGGLSSTQARATVTGPIGRTGAGYLASLRSPFPGLLFHISEGSYLRGESGDWLGKVESPLLAGRLRLLGYGSDTEIDADPRADRDSTSAPTTIRNEFRWFSKSFGAAWTRRLGNRSLELLLWTANGDAAVQWAGSDSLQEHLSASRSDAGLAASFEWIGAGRVTTIGFRSVRSRTTYRLRPDTSEVSTYERDARTYVSAAFLQHQRKISSRSDLDLSLATPLTGGKLRASPSAQLRWKPSDALTFTSGYTRRHQFAQSLRNPESFVSNIFPVDLTIGTGDDGLPVARSDLGVVAVEHRPVPGIRVAAQAYIRASNGLALIAPRETNPFATGEFVEGSGTARGAAVEIAANGAHYGIIASYGYQRVRLEYGDTLYIPEHGSEHSIDAGIIYHPTGTSSIRLGITSLLGRRTTATFGLIEWEACNLLDQGCEFSGFPGDPAEPLGSTRLPAYLRVDLGLRKHWHLRVGGQDWQIAVFAAVSNILDRTNVSAVTVDPETGERARIEMRPRSPLVIGIEWRL